MDDERIAATAVTPRRWWVVAACMSGLVASSAAINTFAFSVLLKPLAAQTGLSRGELSQGIAMGAALTGVASLFAGLLMDRFGRRTVMVPGILVFAVATAAFGCLPASQPALFYLLFVITGIAATAQQPIGYIKTISLWFDERRGLMLGIALSGVGLGASLMPQLAAFVQQRYGTSTAFLALGAAIMVLALVPVAVTFGTAPEESKLAAPSAVPDMAANPSAVGGFGLRDAARDPVFWRINGGLLLAVCAINGTLTHMSAMLTDRGFSAQSAANVVSMAGLFIVAGRISAGWALDRFSGRAVATVFLAAPMAGVALLISGAGGAVPVLGAILCGLGVGAEVDLSAYFLGRYFGVRAIASLFGVSAAVLALATAIGPYAMGRVFDAEGSYRPALIAFEFLLLGAFILFVTLGRYRFATSSSHSPE